MTAPSYTAARPLDARALTALREILDDPSLPAESLAAGPGGLRATRLREALDHLVTVQAGAVAIDSDDAGAQLVASLESLDPDLAQVLGRHVAATRLLAGLERGPARNAVLGDISRGDLVAIASAVREWRWDGGTPPTAGRTLATVHGEIELGDVPLFYDTLLAWLPDPGMLVVVPTYRQGLGWRPAGDGSGHWVVTLDAATVHADDLIPLGRDPRGGSA